MEDRAAPPLLSRAHQVEQWFDLYVDALQQYVARRVGAEVARDVVAETFRTALERFDTFDERRGTASAWLFGIATNLVRRHWRTEQRRLRAYAEVARRSVTSLDPLLAVDGQVDAARRYAEIADAVNTLNPDDLDVLILIAWEDMSSTEAAAVLGLPAGTVRSRLHRVRAQLRSRAEQPTRTKGDSDER